MTKKIATLTPDEDKVWVNAFSFWKMDGRTDEDADRMAWKELQDEFPRLKEYDGCRP